MTPHIVVVGSTMVDFLVYSERTPKRGQTIVGQRLIIGHGGKGANQVVMADRLGAQTTFVSRIGSDVLGEMARANLVQLGLDVSRVKTLEREATGVATIWIEPDGSNRILIVPGANQALSADDVTHDLANVAGADCVMCQLEVGVEAVKAAFRWGREHGAMTMLNPAPASQLDEEMFELVDWLTPNEIEFTELFDASPDDAGLLKVNSELPGGIVVTLGERGAAVVIDDEVVRLPTSPAKAIDTTGAGDAFMGGLAYSLALGEPLTSAIAVANRCGALSTTKRGTQPSFPYPHEALGVTTPGEP